VLIAADLTADERILDISGDDGVTLRTASAWVKHGSLTAVSASAQQSSEARAAASGHPDGARIQCGVGAVEQLPVEDAAADVAWSVNGLAHWGEPAKCIAELRRALRPGGRMLLAATDADALSTLKPMLSSGGFRGIETRSYQDGDRSFTVLMARRSRL